MAVILAPVVSALSSLVTSFLAFGAATGGLYGFYAAVAVLNVAAIALVGGAIKALAPDIPNVDGYAGQKLQTNKNNYSAVPVIYGENKIGSNIIFQETNEAISGATNKDYWSIQIVSDGEINAFLSMYANEVLLTNVSTNIFTNTYVHVKAYPTSGASGIYLDNVTFATNSSGSTSTGATLGLTNIFIPANVSFLAVHQKYDASNHPSISNILSIVQGKQIITIDDPSTLGTIESYSNNPADEILDVMLSLGIQESDIDVPSFYNAKTKCDIYGYTSNIAFVQQANIQSAIQAILATFRGKIVHSEGKWKLLLDEKNQIVSTALTEDDIINNSLSISMRGFQEIANKITVKYINPNDEWLSAAYSIQDDDLIALDGQEIEKVIEAAGCTDPNQAQILAYIILNSMRYTEDESGTRIKQTPLVITFATTIKNAQLDVGDIISLDHSLFDRVRKFTVLSLESDQSGAIKVGAMEYCETHFKDENGNYII